MRLRTAARAKKIDTLSFEKRPFAPEERSGVHKRCVEEAPSRPPVPLSGVPRRVISDAELRQRPLDHVRAFLLSLVDGTSSVETLLDVCAMPRHQALALLGDLLEDGLVTLDEVAPSSGFARDVVWGWSNLR